MHQPNSNTRQGFQALCTNLQTNQVPPGMAIQAFQEVFGDPASAQLFQPLAVPSVSGNLLGDDRIAQILEPPTREGSA